EVQTEHSGNGDLVLAYTEKPGLLWELASELGKELAREDWSPKSMNALRVNLVEFPIREVLGPFQASLLRFPNRIPRIPWQSLKQLLGPVCQILFECHIQISTGQGCCKRLGMVAHFQVIHSEPFR